VVARELCGLPKTATYQNHLGERAASRSDWPAPRRPSPAPAEHCDGKILQGTTRARPAADPIPRRAGGKVDHRGRRSTQHRRRRASRSPSGAGRRADETGAGGATADDSTRGKRGRTGPGRSRPTWARDDSAPAHGANGRDHAAPPKATRASPAPPARRTRSARAGRNL